MIPKLSRPLLSWLAVLIAISMTTTTPAAAQDAGIEHDFTPQLANPAVLHSDALNVAVTPAPVRRGLLLFIGGGQSFNRHPSGPFLELAAALGYQVLALDYVYDPPGTQLCEPAAPPCFPSYRSAKLFGTPGPKGLDVSADEAIVKRFEAALHYLARQYPAEGWQHYFTASGPNWRDISVTGFSQGSGLAAFLAKRVEVFRVILLSSPWDHYAHTGKPAEWLRWPPATPAARWWGLYTRHEARADWLQESYDLLGVPPSHIRVLDLAPQKGPVATGAVTWHWSLTGRDYTPRTASGALAYTGDWRFVLEAEP